MNNLSVDDRLREPFPFSIDGAQSIIPNDMQGNSA